MSWILPRARVRAPLTGAVVTAAALLAIVSQSSAADQKTIAIIVPSLKIAVLQIESKAAVDMAEKLGYKAILLTHEFNTANELKDADQIITEKVAGAVWNVADPDASAVSVKRVRDAGIPVINIDRVLTKATIADSGLQSDNFQCGALAAQAFVDLVGTKGTYAEISGPSADAMSRTRSAGYHSVLDKSGLTMAAQVGGAWDQTKGFQTAGSILQAHPDILGFVTGNDSIGLGAAAAVKAQGKKNLVVVGIDGGADAAQAIQSKTSAFKATAAQPVIAQGEQGVIAMDKILKGDKDAVTDGKVQLIPCTLMK